MIDNYFDNVSNNEKKDLACEIIIELGAATSETVGTAKAVQVVAWLDGELLTQSFADKIYKAITDDNLYKKVSEGAYKKLYRTPKDSADEIYKIMLELIEKKKRSL